MVASDHSSDLRVGPDRPELCATLATADDGTQLCTIYPKHVETDAQTTTWICAEEGSYVALDDAR